MRITILKVLVMFTLSTTGGILIGYYGGTKGVIGLLLVFLSQSIQRGILSRPFKQNETRS